MTLGNEVNRSKINIFITWSCCISNYKILLQTPTPLTLGWDQKVKILLSEYDHVAYQINRRVAEIQILEKAYLIVIKDETGLKFKMNDSTLFLIGSYAQNMVASY